MIRRLLVMGVALGLPAVALAAADGTDQVPNLEALAPAAVPFVLYLAKLVVEHVIPDAVIVKIRDEWIPILAPMVGVVVQIVATGQVEWTQGAIVGLAGVGLHQILKQSGILQKRS